ncbi:MAG TPA: secondary thiamine-phosphate synthase enzyme YjbQ [Firmicutes bacterium]|nr:secondary thiamine-phosphate synthase enzyme YjbQ [Bacillota bacterium]
MTIGRLHTGRQEFRNITPEVEKAVRDSGVQEGVCLVYCPHTTAGLTINENADPDVVSDILMALDALFPDRPEYRHAEGNTAAHLKAGFVGSSVSVPVAGGRLALGVWQGIYFCEFDGPRTRSYTVTVQPA